MPKVLIAIISAHENAARRVAQDETWLRGPMAAEHLFILGLPKLEDLHALYADCRDGPVHEVERRGGSEIRRWSEVLREKHKALFRYAVESGIDYVFKCDDDTYVFPEKLLQSGFEAHDYMGSTEQHHADDLGKYRWCCGGSGFWLSRRALEVLSASGLDRHPADDTCIGQTLAAAGIEPHEDNRFHPAVQDFQEIPRDCITLHKCEPHQMHAIHRLQEMNHA